MTHAALAQLENVDGQIRALLNADGFGAVDAPALGRLRDSLVTLGQAVKQLAAEVEEAASQNPWRQAVVDACVTNQLAWEDDPHKTLASLIAWETRIVLDPAISSAAQALIDRGRMHGLSAATQAVARIDWLQRHADIDVVFHEDKVQITLPVAASLKIGFDSLQELVDAGIAEEQFAAEADGSAANGVFGHLEYVPGLLDSTAPAQIWLQIDTGANDNDREERFPANHEDISWCDERVGGLEIAYVRADLAHRHLRAMESVPLDGTPALLKFKSPEQLPDRAHGYADRWFVGRYTGEFTLWAFAAPVGQGGIPTEWLEGWMPTPDGGANAPNTAVARPSFYGYPANAR